MHFHLYRTRDTYISAVAKPKTIAIKIHLSIMHFVFFFFCSTEIGKIIVPFACIRFRWIRAIFDMRYVPTPFRCLFESHFSYYMAYCLPTNSRSFSLQLHCENRLLFIVVLNIIPIFIFGIYKTSSFHNLFESFPEQWWNSTKNNCSTLF